MTAARVLVTGANGFLGRALVPHLKDSGHEVTEVSRSTMAISADLSSPAARVALQPWRWDVVINLAGPVPGHAGATQDGWETIAAHTNIALNVCSVLRKGWAGRLIHASSMAVYGMPDRLPVHETHARRPIDHYGIAKCVAEDIVASAQLEKELDVWMLRFPGLFSEQRQNGALYNFVSNAARGRSLTIDSMRPTPWEVLHVEDAVEGIIQVMQSSTRAGGAVNLGYGESMNLLGMARTVVARLNSSSSVENISGSSHPSFCMDIEKARSLINWPPSTFAKRLDHFCEVLCGSALPYR